MSERHSILYLYTCHFFAAVQTAQETTPLKIEILHIIMEVWFKSFSFLFMGPMAVGEPAGNIFQGVPIGWLVGLVESFIAVDISPLPALTYSLNKGSHSPP